MLLGVKTKGDYNRNVWPLPTVLLIAEIPCLEVVSRIVSGSGPREFIDPILMIALITMFPVL